MLSFSSPGELDVDLLLELDEHGGEHAQLGAPPRHLQQGQHHVLLVLLLTHRGTRNRNHNSK